MRRRRSRDGLVFEKHYVDENRLKDVIPESMYEDFDGNLRSMERDLLKEYGEGDDANYKERAKPISL